MSRTLQSDKLLEEAIKIDPNFAAAYSFLSYCYLVGWGMFWLGFDDSLDRANELAETGVALDGSSAIGFARLGWIQTWLRRYDQAIENLEKAIALASNNAEVCAIFGQVLNFWGDPKKGLKMLGQALSIDTMVPNWEFQLGHSYYLLRQHDEVLARFSQAIERAPKFTPAQVQLACTYVDLDRLDDAKSIIKTALEISPRFTLKVVAKNWPYRLDEHRDRFLNSLRKADLPEG